MPIYTLTWDEHKSVTKEFPDKKAARAWWTDADAAEMQEEVDDIEYSDLRVLIADCQDDIADIYGEKIIDKVESLPNAEQGPSRPYECNCVMCRWLRGDSDEDLEWDGALPEAALLATELQLADELNDDTASYNDELEEIS